jgi:hypothetical protein
MNKAMAVLAFGAAVPALATTYTVPAGSGSSGIQAIVNTAAGSPGNTVVFSAGTYSLSATVALPCTNGITYTGPVIGPQILSYNRSGVMTIGNLPTATFTLNSNNYVFSVASNGSSYTAANGGCTIQYLGFNGTQGGIFVNYPSSGITLQNNAFYNNNPAWNQGFPDSNAAINLDGQDGANGAWGGVSYISILWNTFFNNCASIQANGWPDSGGDCNAVHVQSYNRNLTIQNNVINQSEEGFKFYEQPYEYAVQFNLDVENNNLQGNSRIMIEDQQPTNGNAVFSHNAFYQPTNPSYNTFELSLPLNQCVSTAGGCSGNGSGAATVANDDVYIGNVPVTINCNGVTCVPGGTPGGSGSGAHYGIGLEQWGVGATATNSLFQGGNGAGNCAAGYSCSGWGMVIGETITNANDTNNYFSGYDVSQFGAFSYEAGASGSNAGMVNSPNTVVATSAPIPTVAPAISTATGSQGSIITLSDSDTNHGLTIFYTTDGSTPAIFGPGASAGTSAVYKGPFTVAPGTVVKAIASWGQGANQGIVFPSFGYVPSSVATLTVAAAPRTLVGAYLHANANTMAPGSTVQFTAYGTYSDGSVSKLPDELGNSVTLWNTTNHSMAKVSTLGHVTASATASGQVNVEAIVGSVKSSPWTMTITPATQTAAPAVAQASQSTVAASAGSPVALPEAASSAASTPAQGSSSETATDAGPNTASGGAPPAASSAPAASGASPAAGSIALGPIPAPPGPALADAFQGPFWKLVNPGGGSASISNGHLFIGVPGGSNHDPLGASNQAVRVMQTIGNKDFDVSIKMDSLLIPTDASTSQGLMVFADNADFVIFALTTDGSLIGLKVVSVSHGVATTVADEPGFNQYQNPMYLRMSRTGSAYTAFYSADGINWTQAASFTDVMIPTAIGPFAGNSNNTPANAMPVVLAVNWFDVQQ